MRARPASTVLIGCLLLSGPALAGCDTATLKRPPPSGPTETTVRPGRFRFVCTIHEAQGQTGTLVVAPR
jgi:plastocyanin